MNWGREQKLEGGPLSAEELNIKYPALAEYVTVDDEDAEEDLEDLRDLKPEEVKRYDHVPLEHHLILMNVTTDPEESNWVIAYQDQDKEEAEARMLELDEEIDGVYELRFVTLTTQVITERVDDDGV